MMDPTIVLTLKIPSYTHVIMSAGSTHSVVNVNKMDIPKRKV